MFFTLFVLKLLAPMIGAAIVGLILIGMALYGFWQVRQVQQWPTTTGTVIGTRMDERRVKTRIVYQPKVSYEYVVNQTRYQSERSFIGDGWNAENLLTAEQQLRRYRLGTEVKVYYNPRRPKDAVLELRTHPALYWMLGGGSLFLCMGLFLGSVILPSAMETCGITPTSTHAQPGSPKWCQG